MPPKSLYIATIIMTLLISWSGTSCEENQLEELITELEIELTNEFEIFRKSITKNEKTLSIIKTKLYNTKYSSKKIKLLIKKDSIEQIIEIKTSYYKSNITKIRFLKGLQIIKLLYEKVLALDHHFTTVNTLNDINKISNPNEYEDFRNVQVLLKEKGSKKKGFNLSNLLGDNIYTSIVHSFVSLFTNSQTSKTEKESNLKNIECILDFTLRMHQNLNTIYFETAFLQKSNETIAKDIEQLFKDYTQPIHYKTSLKSCRENDDWALIQNNLNQYLERLNTSIENNDSSKKIRNLTINLQFPIDRLLQFIAQYNVYIDQGSKFYEKFGIMINSYKNEQHCSDVIPQEYQLIKTNIALSIKKFNTAYRPVEINGSKLKQLLYGINEYE